MEIFSDQEELPGCLSPPACRLRVVSVRSSAPAENVLLHTSGASSQRGPVHSPVTMRVTAQSGLHMCRSISAGSADCRIKSI